MTKIVKILLILNAAVFALQTLFGNSPPVAWLFMFGSLSGQGLFDHGYVWQLVTYMFLHANLMHVFFNMFGLYIFGSALEEELGPARFLTLYLASGALGGLGFALVDPAYPCIGASGAVFGVMAAFATLHPRVGISLLFPPVTLPAWQMVLILAGMDFLYLVRGVHGGIAYAAHVAGALCGFVMAFAWSRGWWGGRWAALARGRPRLFRPVPPRRPPSGDAPSREEMDRILDKMNEGGWSSLTAQERAWLERASRHPPR